MDVPSVLMRKFLLTLIGIAVVASALAQYDNEPREFTMPEERNTVGLSITPAVILLMNGESISPRYIIDYKRQVAPNRKWRFNLTYEVLDRFDDQQRVTPVNWSDTTITLRIDSRDHVRYDFRIGHEWFKPDAKTTMVYGFDAFAGGMKLFDRKREVPFYLDPAYDYYVPSPFTAQTRLDQTLSKAYVGVDFSIGFKVNANDQFNLLIRWMPEVYYSWVVNEVFSDPLQRTEPERDELWWNLRGIEVMTHFLF